MRTGKGAGGPECVIVRRVAYSMYGLHMTAKHGRAVVRFGEQFVCALHWWSTNTKFTRPNNQIHKYRHD